MGVPQGSKLDPLLFYVFKLLTDNTSIYFLDGNLSNLYNVTNFELDKVCYWLLANRLALKIDKTVYLLFSGKKTVSSQDNLFMFNTVIQKKK